MYDIVPGDSVNIPYILRRSEYKNLSYILYIKSPHNHNPTNDMACNMAAAMPRGFSDENATYFVGPTRAAQSRTISVYKLAPTYFEVRWRAHDMHVRPLPASTPTPTPPTGLRVRGFVPPRPAAGAAESAESVDLELERRCGHGGDGGTAGLRGGHDRRWKMRESRREGGES